ncbi:MAG: glycosyltransferase family 4 protein [Deltaproteobacteria bacterium]|nr:glycosyltransferase family 4 protein [Deltaproteobacteria bacterium]
MLLFRWKWLFDYYYRNIDAFVVLSKSSKNILKKYGIDEKKVNVIHQAFSLKDWEAAEPSQIEDNSILFAGWIDEKKGLHILIDAMPEILRKVPNAKLYVLELTSYKEYKNKILKKIDEYGLKDRVFMLGRLSPDEFKEYLKKANVVVVPEQWENMSPVIIAEAMAKAKPIVASRIGGIPEFIEHGKSGLLASHNNPKDFAEKIIHILQDKNKAIEMGKIARQMALEIFDEDDVLNKIVKLYNKVIISH